MKRKPLLTPRSFRGKSPLQIVVLLVLAGLAYFVTDRQPADDLPRGSYEGFCTGVIDGDTLDIRTRDGTPYRIRLLGMDCMEIHNEEKMAKQARAYGQPVEAVRRLGHKARERVSSLAAGRPVTWTIPEGTRLRDPYERVLAYVEVHGMDLGELLLKEGLAEMRRDRHPKAAEYRSIAAPLAFDP
ncbi:MAG: thermonuclease family protein [Kiritimatiellae bacterium]|nr:thermonuclease family protein [Kiritimatiellia bacterium]